MSLKSSVISTTTRRQFRKNRIVYLLAFLVGFVVFFSFTTQLSEPGDYLSVAKLQVVNSAATQYFHLTKEQSEGLAQNDSGLLDYIRTHHLFPPSTKPYNLEDPSVGPPEKINLQWQIAYKLLGNKTKGFFIECGAFDGEFLSNTLALEKDHGWTGILIEGDPGNIPSLKAKQRKAWISDTCLSTKPFPQEVLMQRAKSGGSLSTGVGSEGVKKDHTLFQAKCLPLFSILSAIRVFEIDYFSLDIEMAELPVLQTIPFDSLFIKIFSIELFETNRKSVIDFMESKGYVCIHFYQVGWSHDGWFIHSSLYKPEMKISNCRTVVITWT